LKVRARGNKTRGAIISKREEASAINRSDAEAELVSRIRAGDGQAEAELVERYSRGITIIIRSEIGETYVAEDLYQETFRIALEKIRQGDVRDPKRLSGFVCSVAKNLVIDYFRRAARQERLREIDEASHLPDPAPNQLEELLRKEQADFVWEILNEMSNQRDIEVLYRYYLADDEKEKICADLGLTSLHFNRVIHRARERYMELYNRLMQEKRAR
jgi:RNA polymerase sigma-70 factor, ECF subfamily